MFQYSFASVDLTLSDMNVGGLNIPSSFKIKGYKTGEDLITVARKAPIATTDFSAYGDMVVSMQRNLSVDLVFPLLQNSVENQYLQEWANYFQSLADGGSTLIKPIQGHMVDNMGKDKGLLLNGVILGIPAL